MLRAHDGIGRDDGQIEKGVGEKTPRFTERRKHQPRHRRSDEARGLKQHRLQGDRIGQVLPVFYQLQ